MSSRPSIHFHQLQQEPQGQQAGNTPHVPRHHHHHLTSAPVVAVDICVRQGKGKVNAGGSCPLPSKFYGFW